MNVAIFTDNDFGKVNGVTTTLTAALDCAPPGMQLRVYTAAALPVETPDYLALKSVAVPIPFYSEMHMFVPHLNAYLQRAREDRIDLVHLTTPGPIGLAAMHTAWRLQLPMVGSFHTDLAAYTAALSGSRRLGTLMREYMRWVYGKCSRVLVPSEATRALLVDAKTRPERIDIWRRGVDASFFSPERRSRELRSQWHVSDNRPALLYVGRLSREKGLGVLPGLQRRLHERHVEHRFILVGDGPMRAELQREMPDAVFTGPLARHAVAEVFASADVFVFPSRTDTAGNVVLEAQASGLPVIVSDAGGPSESMIDGSTGIVCRQADPDAWADVIMRILRPDTHAAASRAARAFALGCQWPHALEPLYRAYREPFIAPALAPTPAAVPFRAVLHNQHHRRR
jgi:glycosyltransferase involved in cell wall biosynthesis